MTTSPIAPAAAGADSDGGWETARTDLGNAGQSASSGEYLAGLISEAKLDVVGRPEKLPQYLFPEVDPAVVYDIWNLALAVGFRAGKVAANPGYRRDELAKHRAALAGAGFHAMAGQVARSAGIASRAAGSHPADGESARDH